jgi:hypothetical protein
MSAAFSPLMIEGALVLPDVSIGVVGASATRHPPDPARYLVLPGQGCAGRDLRHLQGKP